MKKTPNNDLYAEAMEILSQSEILKQTVLWQDKQVDKLVHKFTEEELEALPEEEKSAHLKETEQLYARLLLSVKDLKVLDQRYQALRVKVKAKYGKEFMPPLNGNLRKPPGPDDEIELV